MSSATLERASGCAETSKRIAASSGGAPSAARGSLATNSSTLIAPSGIVLKCLICAAESLASLDSELSRSLRSPHEKSLICGMVTSRRCST